MRLMLFDVFFMFFDVFEFQYISIYPGMCRIDLSSVEIVYSTLAGIYRQRPLCQIVSVLCAKSFQPPSSSRCHLGLVSGSLP